MATHLELVRALASLRPAASYSTNALDGTYECIIWHDQAQTKPTKAQFDAEVTRLAGLDSQEATRIASIRADANRSDMLSKLQSSTPAQISTWVDGQLNGTTVTQVRDQTRALIKRILNLIALDSRT